MLGAAGWIDREHQPQEIVQSMTNTPIGELITGTATFRNRDHQPAAAQASQMVGHDLAGDADLLGQIGRVLRRLAQNQQDLGAGGIGKRMTEPSQRIGMHLGFHDSTIHRNLYSGTL